MRSNATRRALLAGVAGAATVGLAGCAGAAGGDAGNAADAGGSLGDGNARLAYVRLVNRHATAHTVHLLVQRAGEPVHWSSHDLAESDAASGEAARTVDRTWGSDPGAYSVYVRLDDADEWTEVSVGDGSADCYGIETRITAEGGVESLFARNPEGCGGSTASDDA
ncbi:hypothetical protein [Halobaculum limi]|uniref:hypothetical protein n=1 Tax=Halobaculum limi TaxID=3031916 RepID=UPI002404F10A|nr:hypothetical protein [Halobaculum sp. YSMS11]